MKTFIKLTKIEERVDALHSHNIETGSVYIKPIDPTLFVKPIVNEQFVIPGFRTSTVQEILDINTFKTYNSVYRWELLQSDENTKNTLIVSAFPGTGKTYFFENIISLKILDSDSSKFDKTDFPKNYIDHIKENIGKVDIIFVSSHSVVRDALTAAGIKFLCICPTLMEKSDYIQRYWMRESPPSLINLIIINWNLWIKEILNNEKMVISLYPDHHITDLLPYFLKEIDNGSKTNNYEYIEIN